MKNINREERNFLLFLCAVGVVSLAQGLGLGGGFASNFYHDAYGIDSQLRGAIELPREIPAMLCAFLVALFLGRGEMTVAVISQAICAVMAVMLGFWTPPFGVLIAVIAVNSLSMHAFFPIQDSLGFRLASKLGGDVGKRIGRIRSVGLASMMSASILVYLGFDHGHFTFKTHFKWVFIASGVAYVLAMVMFMVLSKRVKEDVHGEKPRIKVQKRHSVFYALSALVGIQKQMTAVFAPWVMITILAKSTDFMAILLFIAFFAAIFYVGILGRLCDKFGAPIMLKFSGFSWILLYSVQGALVLAIIRGWVVANTFWVSIAGVLFVVDMLAIQADMVRALYLNGITEDKKELTGALALGMSIDHVLAMASAFLGGWVWANFGAYWVFFGTAVFSIGNVICANFARCNTPVTKS